MMLYPFIFLLCASTAWAIDCTDDQPVGLALGNDGPVPNEAMTESSKINRWHGGSEGRLNNYRGKPGVSSGVGAWCANKNDAVANRYLQIDLGTTRKIGRICTQGRNTTYSMFVKSYTITYSIGCIVFVGTHVLQKEKIYQGNTDKNTVVCSDLPSPNGKPLVARCIRIHPKEFYGNICMRAELYECIDPTTSPPTTKPTTSPPTTKPTTAPPTTTSAPPTCPAGYRLGADNVTCEDVDECADNTALCGQDCHNTNGSYTCSCKAGYRLQADGKACENIDECQEPGHGCAQICIDNQGSYSCGCESGYNLKSDNRTCEDIDECARDSDQCDKTTTTCLNSPGSYSCPCVSGYEKGGDRYKCNDIDECAKHTDQCVTYSTYCTNSPGSYKCNCRIGFETDPVSKFKCNDINECLVNNGGCSHNCTNLDGSYICRCPTGYKVDSSKHNCVDINECLLANGGCEHICTNNNGSYTCSCNAGFKLKADGLTCEDIDECADGSAQCEAKSTTCTNLIPFYECICKPGYTTIPNDKYKCKAKTCAALIEPTGTSVSPSTCLQDQKSVVGDVCTFSCKDGYELPSNLNTLVCLSTGSWNASIINCQKKSCPKLAAPENGNVLPEMCKTVGNTYLETCYYTCSSGYLLTGVQNKICQSSGQWDNQTEPSCQKVYPDPWITCPDSVIITLPPGANTVDVSALLGSPSSNQPPERITIKPEQYNANKIFPAGTTALTYTAANQNGKTAECQMSVIVQDKEKPAVSNCPMPIYVTTTENTKAVSWTPPTFTDNVGVTSVTSTSNPGDTFDQGSTNVQYTAKDLENNAETCSFTVNVKKLQCDPNPTPPENGALSCSNFGGTSFCTPSCNVNKKYFKNVWFIQCSSSTNLEWGEIPDCVDYTSPAADDSCPSGFVKQGSLGGATVENICVKCQKGTYYDSATSTCKNCAIGFVSTEEGSLQCQACPANSSTLVEGSKKCTAQCYAGQFSNSGFDLPANLEPCEPCPKSSFQGSVGQKTCEKCPNDTTTVSNGASSSAECGGPPVISSFGPNPNNATENQATQMECRGHGLPRPSFIVVPVNPAPAGFGGPVKLEYITGSDGNQIGLRYINSKVAEKDAGAYRCKLENEFASVEKYLFVNVTLDFNIGKRRRRRHILP